MSDHRPFEDKAATAVAPDAMLQDFRRGVATLQRLAGQALTSNRPGLAELEDLYRDHARSRYKVNHRYLWELSPRGDPLTPLYGAALNEANAAEALMKEAFAHHGYRASLGGLS